MRLSRTRNRQLDTSKSVIEGSSHVEVVEVVDEVEEVFADVYVDQAPDEDED